MKKSVNKLKQFLSVSKQKRMQIALGLGMLLLSSQPAWAFERANSDIKGYIGDVVKLTKVVGMLVGVIGGLRIYNKWSNGDQDINKEVVGWGGSALFLILAPEFLSAIFNVTY